MKTIILLLVVTLALASQANAQPKTIELKGVYKEIDVARDNKDVEILTGTNTALKQQVIDSILKDPNVYNPPVLYALSAELFSRDKKDDAAFWFYVAQLRARYDANLCMDKSAAQGIAVLNQRYGPVINNYTFQDIATLEKTVVKAVDFVKANEERYDHRWLNLCGMDAVLAGLDDSTKAKELSQPREQWAQIKKNTVDVYYNGFIEYVKNKK